jgi:hypothetical protein
MTSRAPNWIAWPGIIASGMHMSATSTAEQVLEPGQTAALVETESAWSRLSASANKN